LGTLGYLVYQSVLFCFGTPLNDLFLLYVVYLGLAVWSIVFLLRGTDLPRFGYRLSRKMPARAVGGILLAIVVANSLAWLGQIVPALLEDEPGRRVKDPVCSPTPSSCRTCRSGCRWGRSRHGRGRRSKQSNAGTSRGERRA
jgi:hypothetical protein